LRDFAKNPPPADRPGGFCAACLDFLFLLGYSLHCKKSARAKDFAVMNVPRRPRIRKFQ
jgi:hypothetical protein